MNNEYNYYVYCLIDPRKKLPFYVGKGKMKDKFLREYRRIKDHLQFHDKSNKLKNAVIRKILDLGLDVGYEIVKENISEDNAFNIEKELISLYGKKYDGSGYLTNLTNGGEGGRGHTHSLETKEKQSKKRKDWIRSNGIPFKGCEHSEKTKNEMSKIQKERFKRNKGTMTGKLHSDETKELISQKMKQRGVVVPKDQWYKFGSRGANNPQAEKYIFTSPNGEKFEVIGEFKRFIKDKQLSYVTCRDFLNKSTIPEPKNRNHNRMSRERLNSIGWKIEKVLTPIK